jgi:hypothetical protein
MLPADPLAWAIKQFRDDGMSSQYDRYRRYYDGDQATRLSQPHFDRAFGKLYEALTYNRSNSVVDAIADRLRLTGFQGEGGVDVPDDLMAIWNENRMDKREGEVNQEALTAGDGYVIIWPHPQSGRPVIWPQDAQCIRVLYDDEQPGLILLAAKLWRTTDDYIRLNLYLPDRLEKYISRAKHKSNLPSSANAFEVFQPEGDLRTPLGYDWFTEQLPSVPVFHFANNARTGRYGRSELRDVIPLQDGLNYAMALLMSSTEHEGYKQKYATGLPANWQDSGVDVGRDSMLVANDPQAKFGNFEAGDLQSLIRVSEQFDVQIARVSKIPVHYLAMAGDFPSGEALKTAESPFVRKVQDRQVAFGNIWEDVMTLAMRMLGVDVPELEAQYEPAEPQSDKERAELALLYKQAGFPLPSVLHEIGMDDSDIQRVMDDRQGEVEMAQRAFDSGNSPANPDFGNQQQPPQQGAQAA